MEPKRTIIDFVGDNNLLFWRSSVESLGINSVIIVPETHVAMLVKDGRLLDTLEAGRYEIFDKKCRFFGLFKSKTDVLSVHLIYISKTAKLSIKWGTANKFDFRDPQFGVPVRVGACGVFEAQVANPRKFYLEVVGANSDFTAEDLKARLKERMLAEIEPVISRTMREKQLSYDVLSEYKPQMAEIIRGELSRIFAADYGLALFSFTLSNIEISDEDKAALEAKRNAHEAKWEQREEKEERQRETERLIKDLERLDDKEFDRQLALKKLGSLDCGKRTEAMSRVGKSSAAGKGFCIKCGAGLTAGAKFCNQCGAQVACEKTCEACGAVNPAAAGWCSRCGAKL